MQYTVLIAALFASAAVAQVTIFPTCAQPCFLDSATSCAATDYACLCGDSDYFTEVDICVLTDCSTADADTTLTIATEVCNSVGVPLKKRNILGRKH